MNSDYFYEFLKSNPDCRISCFIGYMRKNAPMVSTNHQERLSSLMMKLIFWKFLDSEFFNDTKIENMSHFVIKMIEEYLLECLLLLDQIGESVFEKENTFYEHKSHILSIIGKLNFYLIKIKNKQPEVQFDVSPQSAEIINQAEQTVSRFIKMINAQQPFKDVSNITNYENQLAFFKKHNADFCQICSITDTLNESDYFIFCEVV